MCGVLAGALGACTAMNQVAFESVPAGAAVATTSGQSCPATPCVIEIPRKQEFVASFTNPGYREAQVPVASEMGNRGSAMTVASFALGGVVGGVAYAAGGHGHDHTPNPVIAQLQPLKPVSPLIENRRPRKRTLTPTRSTADQPKVM